MGVNFNQFGAGDYFLGSAATLMRRHVGVFFGVYLVVFALSELALSAVVIITIRVS